ncbi:P-loop NTPase family protein [Phycisphaera mikurensis]|uniref:CobQ/CobB/MinD/ParA nucleotide binding domain-containing protein n=1 Tax=Phycisphaera mikurensis (strain NBRC 102666 / KCTC 22515 / FYK2301M01) TaxID=1142394 RepID=I0IDC0_PHYMF|nr:hypothetical protein [Phycisphaera mikurensis]MBB6442382.1 Mrp family chromosome partitioning ATPase [Phycisphaera mikurensis]BAM03258.1 hypothetical protein PSMK_10990 [Phycisphaera mikurensis NBRC 102666]
MSDTHDPADRRNGRRSADDLYPARWKFNGNAARALAPAASGAPRRPDAAPPAAALDPAPAVDPREPADDASDPGGWGRFCGRAAQRWPLLVGVALAAAVPGAAIGYLQGEPRFGAEVGVELQPRTVAGGVGGVPAEALNVAETLQREAAVLTDLADRAGIEASVSGRPPFGLVVEVRDPDPAGAAASAAALATAFERKTALPGSAEVETAAAARREAEAQVQATRTALAMNGVEVARAEDRLAAGSDPAVLAAAEAGTAQRRRAADARVRDARASARDPLFFAASLVREQPAAQDAAVRAAQAAADALASAARNRGLVGSLGEAAAAAARFAAVVEDARFVEAEDGRRAFVRLSDLERDAAAAGIDARAAASASAVAKLERSALQSLRWKQQELQTAAENAAETAARLRAAPLPAAALDRVTAGEASATPVADARPRGAALGAVLGSLLGALGVLLYLASDDRVSRGDSRPWSARGVAVLGTVPLVRGQAAGTGAEGPLSEREQQRARDEAAALADAVHAVRAMLEGRAGRAAGSAAEPGGRTFAVTSSGPGSGKTGLCLGLAASLAAAGERVLLVDAAWADRPDAEATSDRQTLQTAALRMGYLHPEDADLLEHAEADEPIGLPAFLGGDGLEAACFETKIPGLSLLPAGPGPLEGSRLSGRHIRRLVDEARPLHDVTLIDTSAVAVGLDALFAAAAADGVVLVVSGGERQAAVDRALARLRASGAVVLGTVLNRMGRPGSPRPGAPASARAALEQGWQDQGSGMFAAAVGGSSAHPRRGPAAEAAKADPPEAATPAAGTAADRAAVAALAPAARRIGSSDAAEAEAEAASAAAAETPGFGDDQEGSEEDVALDDVLAAVRFGDEEDADGPSGEGSGSGPAAAGRDDAQEAPGAEVRDPERIAAELAERIASGVPSSEGAGTADAAPPRAAASDEAALDRLVDRHIASSMPASRVERRQEPADGADERTP